MNMFFSQYEYDLYSIASLIVSANHLAMCTCVIIAVLIIYHDVIILILPSIGVLIVLRTKYRLYIYIYKYVARHSYRSD